MKNREIGARINNLARLVGLGMALFWSMTIQTAAYADEALSSQAYAVHVVVMWFEESKTAEEQQGVVEVTRSFKEIPGVIDIRVGKRISSDDESVNDPFSIAMYIVFENQSALQAYFDHPLHHGAIEAGVLDGMKQMETFDFVDRPVQFN